MSVGSIFVDKLWAGFLMIFVPDVELRVHDDTCSSRTEQHDETLVVFEVGSEDSESVTHY